MAKGWKPTIVDGGGSSKKAGASLDGKLVTPRTGAPRRRNAARVQAREAVLRAEAETPLVQASIKKKPRQLGDVPRQPPGVQGTPGRTNSTFSLGDRWTRITQDVKAGEYTWAEFAESLDDQELARAQLKSSDGTFKGRPPKFVPREFLLACQRDQKRRFEEIFSSEVIGIAKEYVKLAQSDNLKDETKAKMMQYAMERIFGGIPKDLRVIQEQPWEQMVVNVFSEGDVGMPEHLARRYGGYQERQGGGIPDSEG